jgi:hypothetical protein
MSDTKDVSSISRTITTIDPSFGSSSTANGNGGDINSTGGATASSNGVETFGGSKYVLHALSVTAIISVFAHSHICLCY